MASRGVHDSKTSRLRDVKGMEIVHERRFLWLEGPTPQRNLDRSSPIQRIPVLQKNHFPSRGELHIFQRGRAWDHRREGHHRDGSGHGSRTDRSQFFL